MFASTHGEVGGIVCTRPGGQDCGGKRRPHGGVWSKSRCQRERKQLENLTKHAVDAMF